MRRHGYPGRAGHPGSAGSPSTGSPAPSARSAPQSGHYTVRQAAEDWLAHGLDGRSAKTITKNQNVLQPILKSIGARKLRELTAADVRQALLYGGQLSVQDHGLSGLQEGQYVEARDALAKPRAAAFAG